MTRALLAAVALAACSGTRVTIVPCTPVAGSSGGLLGGGASSTGAPVTCTLIESATYYSGCPDAAPPSRLALPLPAASQRVRVRVGAATYELAVPAP